MRAFLLGWLLLFSASGAPAHDKPSAADAAARMRAAADRLLASLPARERDKALRPFDDRDRLDSHYTPRSRNGVSFKDIDASGRDAVHALLKQALSAAGHAKAVNIIELELVLKELETFGLMRDPERYHLTIYGTPDRKAVWGWRFEGHHVSLNFTLAGDKAVSDTPSFFGANPALVTRGSKKGLRVLADEEDEARLATYCGLRVDTGMRVLRADGVPVPGPVRCGRNCGRVSWRGIHERFRARQGRDLRPRGRGGRGLGCLNSQGGESDAVCRTEQGADRGRPRDADGRDAPPLLAPGGRCFRI